MERTTHTSHLRRYSGPRLSGGTLEDKTDPENLLHDRLWRKKRKRFEGAMPPRFKITLLVGRRSCGRSNWLRRMFEHAAFPRRVCSVLSTLRDSSPCCRRPPAPVYPTS